MRSCPLVYWLKLLIFSCFDYITKLRFIIAQFEWTKYKKHKYFSYYKPFLAKKQSQKLRTVFLIDF